ncbi:MAG: peptidoglycan D,D-transpeptidase FtsI family protein, partial [Acidimicrobiales bacterium]
RVPAAIGSRTPLQRRVKIFRYAIVLAALVVVARLVDVQVLHSSQYQKDASEELTVHVTVPALRGAVTDRSGVVLETSVPTKMVVADDFQVTNVAHEARALAPLLGLDAAKLTALLTEKSGYVPLVRDLGPAKSKEVAARAFPGITLVDSSQNVAAAGDLAAPVVGGVNGQGQGDAGLEAQYDAELSGHPGSETLLESPLGVQLPGTAVTKKAAAVAGTGLELTLDEPLQYTAEQYLAQEIVASHAQSGEAVVMDVQTGQILAMANLVASSSTSDTTSAPASAPAATNTSSTEVSPVDVGATGPVQEAPSNAAVTQLYEPGSVFKLVTFSAALGDGLIGPDSAFTVPDTRTIDGDLFHDATPHPTEQMSATQILAQSSNIGTLEIAQELGETRILEQVKQLGFGSTSLRFPGESEGLYVTPATWSTTDYVSLAIGQADAVSAMEILDAYNAIAHGGEYVAPKLVRATVGADGATRTTAPSAAHQVVSPQVAGELTTMLEQVVDGGTGVAAAVPGYLVAGKTGTSQIPAADGSGYIPGAYDATFVGFAPANHPVLSAIVMLNRPTPIYGGAVAAPVFSKIMAYALHRYDVPTSPGLHGKPQVATPQTLTALVKEAT